MKNVRTKCIPRARARAVADDVQSEIVRVEIVFVFFSLFSFSSSHYKHVNTEIAFGVETTVTESHKRNGHIFDANLNSTQIEIMHIGRGTKKLLVLQR